MCVFVFDINGKMSELGCEHERADWKLFIMYTLKLNEPD